MNIYAQVFDNDKAFTIYEIPQKVTVLPNCSILDTIMNKLIAQDIQYQTNIILNSGSYLPSLEEIQGISSILNEQSLQDKLGLTLNGSGPIFPQIFGPLSNYSGVVPVCILNKKNQIFYRF